MTAALNPVQLEMDARPRLAPRIHPCVRDFLNNCALVHELVRGFGSPLNVIFPENIDENIRDFQDVYKKHALRGRIYFTSKPCKSKAVVRRASLHDIGADVSSAGSLNHVMSCGFAPDRIEATGPKNAEYILTCLQLDVLLNADSMAELQLIEQLHRKLGLSRKARIMVRVSGFSSPRVSFTPQDNTFGTDVKAIPALIDWLIERKDSFDFQGFSFHTNDMSEQKRLVAIENTLELTFLSVQKGLKPSAIDIGGGFAIRQAADKQEWLAYVESLKQAVIDEIPPQIWNNNGLGYKNHQGVVAGGPLFMDHYPVRAKGEELDFWLSQRSPVFGNAPYADVIRDSLLYLNIEPGRSLLDQCGITLGRVAFMKESSWGESLAGLEMNRSNIHSAHIKNLCEPIIIPAQERTPDNEKGVYYMGNLCLSYDIIQYNKTYPDIAPQRDDVIAFINTAAYMMDFTESETLMQPIAKKVAVWPENSGQAWAMDEKYLPVDVSGENV